MSSFWARASHGLDTGTHESLVEATNFVKTVETHQHRKIACLEEIGYLRGWITREQVLETTKCSKRTVWKIFKGCPGWQICDKIHPQDF